MRYRAYLLFGFMVAAAAVLMMDPPFFGTWMPKGDVAYSRSLAKARLTAQHRLRGLRALDSLGRELHTKVGPGGGAYLRVADGLETRHTGHARDLVQGLMDEQQDITGPLRVGLFLLPVQSFTDRGLPASDRSLTFAGEVDGVPYCLHMDEVPNGPPHSVTNYRSGFDGALAAVGLCAWVAKLGLPGSGIAAWLNATQGTAGRRHQGGGRTLFEQRRVFDRVQQACLGGDRSACGAGLRAMRSPHEDLLTADGTAPFLVQINRGGSTLHPAVAVLDSWVLAGLEREFGTEALRAFWTSKLLPTEAFLQAFGVEADDWFYERLVGSGKVREQLGPAPDSRELLIALTFAGLGLWFSTGFARRRKVGG